MRKENTLRYHKMKLRKKAKIKNDILEAIVISLPISFIYYLIFFA